MPTATTAIANVTPSQSAGPPAPAGGPGPAAAPGRRVWRRAARAGLSLGCLGFAGWALLPPLSGVSTDRAVVNAPLVTIRSPIEGTVTMAPALADSAAADGAGELIEVGADLRPDSRLEPLRGEVAALKVRAAAGREQLQTLAELSAELAASARQYQAAAARRLECTRDAARSAAEQARVTQKQRDVEHEFSAGVVGSGGVSRQEVITTRLAAEAARHATAHEAHLLARVEEELRAVKQGVFLGEGDGRADLPYSAQRRHEVALRRADLQTALRYDAARLVAAEAQLRDEEERVARRSRFRAAAAGVVWRRHVADGSTVSAGSPLVDCLDPSAIFIDAVVPDSYLSWLRPGREAVVRRVGTGETVAVVVKRVGRRELPWADQMLAAEPPAAGQHEVHVLLSPVGDPPAGLGIDSVGCSLEVTFRRDWREALAHYLGGIRP